MAGGDMGATSDGGIKPAKDLEEAREHPVDPALAEEKQDIEDVEYADY